VIGDSDRRFQLADGRSLGYCELGDPQGKLIFFVGGYPGSRWMAHLFAGSPMPGIRLVGVDRPGMGLSDFRPEWRIR
jgi:pimeloyl-ACP methyl ester carboxylesterase